jgi:hypothetical protein
MHINRPVLNRHVGIFLRSRSAGPIFDEIETSFTIRLIVTAICLVCALVVDQMRSGPSDSVLIACVATPGDEGVIQQIPWRIVNDSVTV